MKTAKHVFMVILMPILTKTKMKINANFQLMGENCPTLVLITNQCWVVLFFSKKEPSSKNIPLQSTKFPYKIKSVKVFDGFTMV
jgi:hypothetical protein